MNQPDICVYACLQGLTAETRSELKKKAESLADRLGVPFFSGQYLNPKENLPDGLEVFPYIFYYDGVTTSILQLGKGAPGPVSASFLGGKTEHRLKFGGGKGQMIAKAVGLNKGVTPSILDATAGLGRDAFVLASLGCQVTMLERSPLVAELLREALNEDVDSPGLSIDDTENIQNILARMSLIETDASSWLNDQCDPVADVIYLDPMYPHREKSSLVKKEMRLFQTLVGEDLDDQALLEAALKKARYRVVVKRPRKGDMIKGKSPSLQLNGKSCRYDIYTLQKIENLSI
jgi:16S rRNA (guanine1516-N2)-methyltransferase